MADFEIYYFADSINLDVSYIGKATPGSISSASVWQIQRITTSGDNVHIEWADGNNNFDNILDSRESLDYS